MSKKNWIYLGVGLVGAYFLFPHATQMLDYLKNKIKKPEKPEEKEKPKKVCNCITSPCNC